MKTKKILIILMLIMSFSLIFQINTVQAALQANGNTVVTKNRNTWMTEIRKMETLGGTLGLQEEINTTNLTATGESNKLDIHMQKNTEYGAMALLSASSYGKPDKINNGETTTGNPTGVKIEGNKEWVAAQFTDYMGKTNYANRYINYYTLSDNKKSGDALLETQGWHGAQNIYYYKQTLKVDDSAWWFKIYAHPGGILRNYNGVIFGFANDDGSHKEGPGATSFTGSNNANISKTYTSRAVIVNGEGI